MNVFWLNKILSAIKRARAKKLDEHTFKTIIDSSPLISIDLIIRNDSGRIILGRRLNRLTQGLGLYLWVVF